MECKGHPLFTTKERLHRDTTGRGAAFDLEEGLVSRRLCEAYANLGIKADVIGSFLS